MKKVISVLPILMVVLTDSFAMIRRSPSPMPRTAMARLAAEESNKTPTQSPVFRHRRASVTERLNESYPLPGAPNIMVETYFSRNEERSYDTLVIDRNAIELRERQLFRLTTFSHVDALVAHQAAEDWCNKMFPTMAHRLLDSPPQIRRRSTLRVNLYDNDDEGKIELPPAPDELPSRGNTYAPEELLWNRSRTPDEDDFT